RARLREHNLPSSLYPNDKVRAATRKRSCPSPSPKKAAWSPTPKRISPWRGSPRKGLTSSSFNLSPRALAISPQITRRSWSRSSLKGTNRRKSLPPFHQDVTELSKSISLDLPETDRLSRLLLSSFQVRFKVPERTILLKTNYLCITLGYSPCAVVICVPCFFFSRQLERCKTNDMQVEPASYLGASQAKVLSSKPNYQKILDSQGEVFDCMELMLDELQQAVKLLQAFTEDSTQYLRNLSEQLGKQTFQPSDSKCFLSKPLLLTNKTQKAVEGDGLIFVLFLSPLFALAVP
uniref:DSN1 component of MIS12 kinetochore complex n=1 Tax=Chelonoidis abingdonii TaxID=106734 RepID=A0A8C0JAP2_CHEAB